MAIYNGISVIKTTNYNNKNKKDMKYEITIKIIINFVSTVMLI